MKYFTYLIYIILWEGMVFGGTGYVVFQLNHSGWWMLAAFFVGSCAYSPLKWIHGQDKSLLEARKQQGESDD